MSVFVAVPVAVAVTVAVVVIVDVVASVIKPKSVIGSYQRSGIRVSCENVKTMARRGWR